ncbi:DUF1508 domain-containing protein [Arthrobacter sp. NPDC058130]|uniref:DUF1508 domain-containing protein n=1 Tax=Arthrobacter sp. NPDC058130 TaxID=3346353 RepID=UPI0036EBB7D6
MWILPWLRSSPPMRVQTAVAGTPEGVLGKYKAKTGAMNGVESVEKNAGSDVVDLTEDGAV